MKQEYFIALGGNIGDTRAIFQEAIKIFNAQVGNVIKLSRLYKSKPLPTTHGMKQDPYLNAVLLLNTELNPKDLLGEIHRIEEDLGRDRLNCVHWGPRTIDLDIISVGNLEINTPTLTIPHPRMTERDFVLLPIKDLDSNYIHPSSQLNIDRLISNLPDENHFIESILT